MTRFTYLELLEISRKWPRTDSLAISEVLRPQGEAHGLYPRPAAEPCIFPKYERFNCVISGTKEFWARPAHGMLGQDMTYSMYH